MTTTHQRRRCYLLMRIADKKGHHTINDDGNVEPRLRFEVGGDELGSEEKWLHVKVVGGEEIFTFMVIEAEVDLEILTIDIATPGEGEDPKGDGDQMKEDAVAKYKTIRFSGNTDAVSGSSPERKLRLGNSELCGGSTCYGNLAATHRWCWRQH
uniref:Uncharacterized protein n=1 Tax=Nelumbo nucifera TaxID=4432 RepID=A0A822Y4M4_NELNU|nr:TPA_asm: hypothetical protein HUJ06_027737 [Nelumbo nucifera]